MVSDNLNLSDNSILTLQGEKKIDAFEQKYAHYHNPSNDSHIGTTLVMIATLSQP